MKVKQEQGMPLNQGMDICGFFLILWIRENSDGWTRRLKRLWRGQKIIHKEEGKWDDPVAQLEELPTDWVEHHPRETGDETPEPLAKVLEKLRAEEAARREAAQTEQRRTDQLREAREELEAVIRKNEEEEKARKALRAAELKAAAEEEKARKAQRAAELKKATEDMHELLAGAKWSGGPAERRAPAVEKSRVGQPGTSKSMKEIDVISLAETEEEENAPTPPPPASVAKFGKSKFGNEKDGTLTFVRKANRLIVTEDDEEDNDDGGLTVRNLAGPSTWCVPKGPSGKGRRI
uniref:Uncharacterized protein n=1 Tax=Globodera rostochiensis TaxID=31243 RepID=A0A914IH26_GLORO